ncbi:hypothetical protein [Kiloniella sp. b19]|uniref:hypothetical protein n=1 Tax=Kiloniella sp. GXU_MW_B19 TaxID=3141326 RepID=UPI0031E18A90
MNQNTDLKRSDIQAGEGASRFAGKNAVRSSFMALGALLLSACGVLEPEAPPPACPEVVVLAEAAEMTRFVGQGRDLTDVSFEVEINNFALNCVLEEDRDEGIRRLDNRLVIRFEASQGPANAENMAKLNYFVAITDLNDNILQREAFDILIPFQGNDTSVALVDNVFPSIPLKDRETGEDFIIYLGLEVSRAELYYNRTRF